MSRILGHVPAGKRDAPRAGELWRILLAACAFRAFRLVKLRLVSTKEDRQGVGATLKATYAGSYRLRFPVKRRLSGRDAPIRCTVRRHVDRRGMSMSPQKARQLPWIMGRLHHLPPQGRFSNFSAYDRNDSKFTTTSLQHMDRTINQTCLLRRSSGYWTYSFALTLTMADSAPTWQSNCIYDASWPHSRF
jgi:hypothetical protein